MLKTSLLKHVLVVIAITALLCGGVAQAGTANSPGANKNDDQLKTALAAIEKEKANARAEASKALEKGLTPLERDWGIKILGIRRTAAGFMLHLKFRVLDPEKAYQLLKHDKKTYVILERNGAVLKVPFAPKVGSLRSSVRTANMVKKNYNYATLFANPGGYVKRGEKVTLVIGNFMAEHLTVQ